MHVRGGNGSASYGRGGHRLGKHGKGSVGKDSSRECARHREDGQDVCMAQSS
jgi:hypothetical protein